MKIHDIMTRRVACCLPDTGLREVAGMMAQFDCGEIPVLELGEEQELTPVGVVTDRDIVCRLVAQGINPFEATAGDCMSSSCVTAYEDDDMGSALSLMQAHRIRRLPVVDEQGELCGIISQADIARHAEGKGTGRTVREISAKSEEVRDARHVA